MAKIWCEKCNGKGRDVVCISKPGVRGFECIDKGLCLVCHGKCYTEEPNAREFIEAEIAEEEAKVFRADDGKAWQEGCLYGLRFALACLDKQVTE